MLSLLIFAGFWLLGCTAGVALLFPTPDEQFSQEDHRAARGAQAAK